MMRKKAKRRRYIELGKIKAKFAGNSAGHNGIESIDKFIGKDYSRIRIGIGRPDSKEEVADHVLKNFNEEEKEKMIHIINEITSTLLILIDKKLELFSSKVNQK